MKKQIVAVIAVLAVAGTIAQAAVLDEDVVQSSQAVDLTGTLTGNNGAKTKLSDIPLTWAETTFSTSSGGPTTTVTRAWLAASITTTTVVDIVGTSTNNVTIVTGFGTGVVFQTDNNTGVNIAKGSSGEYADVFFQTTGPSGTTASNATLYVDAKLKVNTKTQEESLSSAKVYGIWSVGQNIISGTLKPSKGKK